MENGHNYGIDHLDLGTEELDSEKDSGWLFLQGRKDQMETKNNIRIRTRNKCNVL